MKKVLILAACALASVVSPVQAKSPNAAKPAKPAHTCTPINVAYVAYGTLVSGSLIANTDGTYNGDLTVAVKHTNEHARADLGVDTPYTLDHARLHIHRQDPAALIPNSRIKLIGKTTMLRKACDQTGFTPTTVIQRGFIKAPKPSATVHASLSLQA